MFCSKCGNNMNNDAKFCGVCGNPNPNFNNQPVNNYEQNQAPTYNYQQYPQYTNVNNYSSTNNNKKSSKGLIYVLILLLVIGGGFFAYKYFSKNGKPKDSGTRTIMVYMIGSNLETESGAATSDLSEMIASNFNNDVNVLIYTGGSKKWYTNPINENENAIYKVTPTGLEKLISYDRSLMTDPTNLTTFLDYAYDNYKTDLYSLILWDHGGGPIGGYGLDEYSMMGKTMSLDGLRTALQNSKLLSNNKLEFVGFDACLMGSIEVANYIKGYANYLIGSEEVEPGYGWNYGFLTDITKDTKTEEIGKNIVNSYISFYDNYPYKVNLTLSILNLSKIDNLINKLDDLFNILNTKVNVNTFKDYSKKLTKSTVYGSSERGDDSYDLVDVYDLIDSLESDYPNEVSEIKNAFKDVVIESKTNMGNSHGISMYFPTYNKKLFASFLEKYKIVTMSNDYYSFLQKYGELFTTNVASYLIDSHNLADNSVAISTSIPNDLIDNYDNAFYTLYIKNGNNSYTPILQSTSVRLEEKTLISNLPRQQFIIDNGDNSRFVTAIQIQETKTYGTYSVIGNLYKGEDVLPISLILKQDYEEETLELIDVKLRSNEETNTEVAQKGGIGISKWDRLEIQMSSYELFDNKGKRVSTSVGNVTYDYYMLSLNPKEKINFKAVDLKYKFNNKKYDYYYEFSVVDKEGNTTRLDLIKGN